MQCPNCGNAVKPDSKFCPRCAFNMQQAAKPAVEKPAAQQPDAFEKKWEQAAQQYGQQASRQPEPPGMGSRAEAPTTQSCPRCRAEVKPGQKFCMSCAAPLGDASPAKPSQPAPHHGQPQPAQPFPQQAQQWSNQPQQPYPMQQPAGSNKGMLIALIAGVLVLAGAGVGAYFLFLKDKGTTESNATAQSNQTTTGANSNRPSDATNTNTRTTQTNTTTTATGLSAAANGVLQAMKEGNVEMLKTYMSRNATRSADEIFREARAKGEIKSFKMVSDPVDLQGTAIATFAIDYANGGESAGYMNLENENGTWKLVTFFAY